LEKKSENVTLSLIKIEATEVFTWHVLVSIAAGKTEKHFKNWR
jgi:hypothetical protein